MLKIQDLEKYYKKNRVLHHINLSIDPGSFVVFMGNSGSGKTTLLQCIATLTPITRGRIALNDTLLSLLSLKDTLRFRKETLAYIPQDYKLLEHLTALENMRLNAPKYQKDVLEHLIHFLDMSSTVHAFPHQLSGGQKQRVAAIRALLKQSELLIADEPTGALDALMSRKLLELFVESQATVLMATHDVFSAAYADRVIFLHNGTVYHELQKGDLSRDAFREQIIHTVTILGGELM